MTWPVALLVWTGACLLAGAAAALAYGRAAPGNQVVERDPDQNEFTHGWGAEP